MWTYNGSRKLASASENGSRPKCSPHRPQLRQDSRLVRWQLHV